MLPSSHFAVCCGFHWLCFGRTILLFHVTSCCFFGSCHGAAQPWKPSNIQAIVQPMKYIWNIVNMVNIYIRAENYTFCGWFGGEKQCHCSRIRRKTLSTQSRSSIEYLLYDTKTACNQTISNMSACCACQPEGRSSIASLLVQTWNASLGRKQWPLPNMMTMCSNSVVVERGAIQTEKDRIR